MEPSTGIEPVFPLYQSGVLPFDDKGGCAGRLCSGVSAVVQAAPSRLPRARCDHVRGVVIQTSARSLVEDMGVEPMTLCLQGSAPSRRIPRFGASVREEGVDPSTSALSPQRSTDELLARATLRRKGADWGWWRSAGVIVQVPTGHGGSRPPFLFGVHPRCCPESSGSSDRRDY